MGRYIYIDCYICVMISTFAVVFSGQNYKKTLEEKSLLVVN